jgi:hypothetical protein
MLGNRAAMGGLRSGADQKAQGEAALIVAKSNYAALEKEREKESKRRELEAEVIGAAIRMALRADCPDYLLGAVIDWYDETKD